MSREVDPSEDVGTNSAKVDPSEDLGTTGAKVDPSEDEGAVSEPPRAGGGGAQPDMPEASAKGEGRGGDRPSPSIGINPVQHSE